MQLGPIESVILFGGGAPLIACLQFLRDRSVPTTIFTSERQINDRLHGSEIAFAEALDNLGATYYMSEDIGTEERLAQHLGPTTLGLSLDSAWIFDREFIDRFNGRLLNSHGARLPHFRGGGGFTWPMLRKTQLGYSLVHFITPGIDDGSILSSREYQFPDSCRFPEDRFVYASEQDAEFLCDVLEGALTNRSWNPPSQPDYLSTYSPRLHTPIHGVVDWSWSSEEIVNFVTAFDRPYPGASTFYSGGRVILRSAVLTPEDGRFHPFQAGLVFRKISGLLSIAARPHAIGFEQILDEDGNDLMPRLRLGDRLHTPTSQLDEARTFRATYTARGLRTATSIGPSSTAG